MIAEKHNFISENRLSRMIGCWLLFACLCVSYIHAQTRDSLRISIITCAPGDDLYTLFGHTAIRVIDYQLANIETDDGVKPGDWIFNYGAFDYRADKFVYRFVKGETDYVLAAEPSSMFFKDLIDSHRLTTEQVLNLSSTEKKRLFDFLKYNIRPENRVYRYNWLYYNCTNRAMEVVENAVEGRVEYGRDSVVRTAREILRCYTNVNSWCSFGIDMILGTEIDRPLTHNQQMFIPQIYQSELDKAVIVGNDGSVRPLVAQVIYPVNGREYGEKDDFNWPKIVMAVLLAFMIGLGVVEWKRKKVVLAVDVMLCLAVGLAGCLVAFLFFVSEHPGTSTNWWIIMFNPIPLMFIPFILRRKGTKIVAVISLAAIIVQLVVLMVVGQGIDDAMLILASILLIRIIGRTYIETNKNTK